LNQKGPLGLTPCASDTSEPIGLIDTDKPKQEKLGRGSEKKSSIGRGERARLSAFFAPGVAAAQDRGSLKKGRYAGWGKD